MTTIGTRDFYIMGPEQFEILDRREGEGRIQGGVIRDESDTSTRLDTLRIEYEDRLLGEGDTYP